MLNTLYARKVYIEMYPPLIREPVSIESISNYLNYLNGTSSIPRSKYVIKLIS